MIISNDPRQNMWLKKKRKLVKCLTGNRNRESNRENRETGRDDSCKLALDNNTLPQHFIYQNHVMYPYTRKDDGD